MNITFHSGLTVEQVQRFIGRHKRLRWVPGEAFIRTGQLDIPRVDLKR